LIKGAAHQFVSGEFMLYPRRPNKDGNVSESSLTSRPASGENRAMLFDGKTDRKLSLDGFPNLKTFTIDLRLTSAELPAEPQPYSETTPAMPFVVGSTIVCRTEPTGYLIVLREGDKDLAKAEVSALFGSTRITIVSSPEGATIFGNGVEVGRASSPVTISGHARLGAGHLKRFWAGEIEYFDIFDRAKVDRDTFNPASARLNPEGRIASLPA
jgi:hypothetical protein